MDVAGYRRASHAVWEAMAEAWDARHAFFERTAAPVTERLLDRLRPEPGATILELAAGTGIVGLAAAALVGEGGRVIVSDFSEAMVEVAGRRARELGLARVECRVLDAEHLELEDGAVDGVVCRWGYMLMAEPGAALVETRRVLRAGGRLSCAVFAGPEDNPWAAIPARVLQERGHLPPPDSGAPGILALADRDRLAGLVAAAGFREVAIEDVAFTWRFADVGEYWDFLAGTAGAVAMVLARLDPGERVRVREALEERLGPHASGGGVELPAVSLVVSAS